MRIGLYLPQIGPAATAATLTQFAQSAETLGYDSLWALDHVVLREEYGTPYPYSEDGRMPVPATANFLEALTTLTYAAAVTERVELGTAVLILPMRAPVLHAKMIATLDHLAGGRVILGAGLGWWKEEFAALGMPFDRRGARLDEYIQVLRQLWTREYADFRGEFYDASGWSCHPQPPRPVPIWLGGDSPRQLARIGRYADGWIANPTMLGSLERDFDRAREAAVAAGRSAAALGLAVNRAAVLVRGRLEGAAEQLTALKERGVDQVILLVNPAEPDVAGLLHEFAEGHLGALQG